MQPVFDAAAPRASVRLLEAAALFQIGRCAGKENCYVKNNELENGKLQNMNFQEYNPAF